MKTQINPTIGIGIIVIVILLVGWFMYRNLTQERVDTSASMSPELKQKIISAYGGGQKAPGVPRNAPSPAQGSR